LAKIMIVDDDPQLRQSFERLLAAEGHTVKAAPTGEGGLDMVLQEAFDLVILDVRLPGMNGLETFQAIRQADRKLPVIIMTAYGTTETAIEATKMGAFDYVLKPFEVPDILMLIEQALRAGRFMRSRVEMDVSPETAPPDAIVGKSPVMQEVYKAIGRVAPTDATVLIRGESGTGKELVARAIYQHSLRAENPFLVINCVAIPETLLESELFGYEKGAFTGAVSRRVGKIEQAHGGTIFLDEIGDMPFAIQAKVLRLLQERHIERLGGRGPIPVDVRIIAATNRDLEQAVSQGRFREDLYYRLNVVTLWLPTLHERKEDIALLADYFLARFAGETGVHGPELPPEALEILLAQDWPGNVRELANTIQKSLILSRGGALGAEDIERAVRESGDKRRTANTADGEQELEVVLRRWIRGKLERESDRNLFEDIMEHFACAVLRETLVFTGGNRSKAAKLLNVSRPTLLAKMEKYGLRIKADVT